jgi:hypothetical protein
LVLVSVLVSVSVSNQHTPITPYCGPAYCCRWLAIPVMGDAADPQRPPVQELVGKLEGDRAVEVLDQVGRHGEGDHKRCPVSIGRLCAYQPADVPPDTCTAAISPAEAA